MNRTILSVALVFAAVLRLQAEICPLWNSITVTTSDPGQVVTIQAARDAKRLTNVAVCIGAHLMSVPASELRDATDPQLHTLRFGYWTKDLKRSYVFVTCGGINSAPYGKQPKDLYFYFDSGRFSGVQSSPTPITSGKSVEPGASGDGKPRHSSEATAVPPLERTPVAAIERQFGGPLAGLRRATERYAASGDASALQSAEDGIRQPGVLRACIAKVGQTTMPTLSFAEIVGGEESQTRGERSITEGTVTLKGGEVVSVVSYHAAVTNAAGQEIFYTLTVRRDSLGKP